MIIIFKKEFDFEPIEPPKILACFDVSVILRSDGCWVIKRPSIFMRYEPKKPIIAVFDLK